MKFAIILLMFFIIAGLIIINNHNLHLNKEVQFGEFKKLYFNWFGEIYSNIFKATGYAVKLGWIPN